MTRLSMPVRSFLSSKSFWKFSIFIMAPWSCSAISEMSAREAEMMTERQIKEKHYDSGNLEAKARSRTSAVPEVIVGGWVVLAEPL